MTDDGGYLGARQLADQFRRGERSVVETTRDLLDRIESSDRITNAFVTITRERALQDADRAERAYREGAAGPLCGVPYTLKDLVPTRGIPTGYGSRVWNDLSPAADAPIAERLAATGAVLLGKTTTPEHGFKGDSGNPRNGPCGNPWRSDRTPGGSSSGAAVAAALGFGPLHQGSDGAGSIRIPAAFCGVFGHKPTFGLIAYPPGGGFCLSHLGPIARTVDDAAMLLDAMVGFDPRDRLSVPPPEVSFAAALREPLRPLRIAFSPNLGYAAVEEGVAAAVADGARIFAELGHSVEEVDLDLDDPWWIERELWLAMFAARCPEAVDRRDEVSPGLVRLVEEGRRRPAVAVAAALDARSGLVLALEERLSGYDLLVCPTLPCTAFRLGNDDPGSVAGRTVDDLGWTAFCYPFNLTGQPAASVPCGLVDGLPVGLQIVGRRLEDALVLRAASVFEEARPFDARRPSAGNATPP